jgi:hypothetical protein
MLTKRCECIGDDIHDRVHPETSRSGDADGEVCVVRHEKDRKLCREYREKDEKSKGGFINQDWLF